MKEEKMEPDRLMDAIRIIRNKGCKTILQLSEELEKAGYTTREIGEVIAILAEAHQQGASHARHQTT